MPTAKGCRRCVTLPKKVLKVLRQSPLPVATADLAAICAGGSTRRVWDALLALEKTGAVFKEIRVARRMGRNRVAEFDTWGRVAFWRLAE